jgi:hypothetical protein
LHFNSNLFYSKIAITSAILENGNITLNLASNVIQNTVEGVSSFENQQIAVSGIFLKNTITNIVKNGNFFKITLSKYSGITLDDKTITLEGFTDTAWNGVFDLHDIKKCNNYDIIISSSTLQLPTNGYGYAKQYDFNNVFCGNKIASLGGSGNVLTYAITNQTIPDAELPDIVIDNAFIKYQWKVTLALDIETYIENFLKANPTQRQLVCMFGETRFTDYAGNTMDDNTNTINGSGLIFNVKKLSNITFYALFPFVQNDLKGADKTVILEQVDSLETSLIRTICKNLDIEVVDANGLKKRISSIKPLSSQMFRITEAYYVHSYSFSYTVDLSSEAYYNRPIVRSLQNINISIDNEETGLEMKRTQNQF